MAYLEFIGKEEDHLFHHHPMFKSHHLVQILHHPHNLPTLLVHILANPLPPSTYTYMPRHVPSFMPPNNHSHVPPPYPSYPG